MKARLSRVVTALVLALIAVYTAPGHLAAFDQAPAAQSCLSYCSKVRCIGDDICGLYTNSSGQQVCGCHPRF